MRVLFLNPEFPPLGGGAANASKYILREMSKTGIKVDCITASPKEERTEEIFPGITGHFLDIKKIGSLHYYSNRQLLTYSKLATKKARQLMQEHHYTLIHAFFGIPSGAIAMRLGLPYIVSLRGSDVPFYNERFKWPDRLFFKHLSKQIWKKSYKTIANSTQLAALAKKTDPSIIIPIIQNGIDIKEFHPTQQPKSEKIRILCVSRLIERKGIRSLIQTIADLQNNFPNLELYLAGDGNIRNELEALAEKKNIRHKIHFLGSIDHKDLPAIYQQADIFALPSKNEGMSNTALEALASGLPLILTNTGGAKELTEGNGILVPVHNQEKLNQAMSTLVANKKLRIQYGKSSRKKALQYSWAETAKAYIKIYKNAALQKE